MLFRVKCRCVAEDNWHKEKPNSHDLYRRRKIGKSKIHKGKQLLEKELMFIFWVGFWNVFVAIKNNNM